MADTHTHACAHRDAKEVSLRQNIFSVFLSGHANSAKNRARDSAAEDGEGECEGEGEGEGECEGEGEGMDVDPASAAGDGTGTGTGADGGADGKHRSSGRERKAFVPGAELTTITNTLDGRDMSKVPVALALIRGSKGVDVNTGPVITAEDTFEEDLTLADDDDDAMFNKYLRYTSGKYYAVALVNNEGKRIKVSKESGTVTFTTHREGFKDAISYAPLDEPWADNIYYFTALNYKRSGSYTVSFVMEGPNLAHIQPLVFRVKVKASRINCGAASAMSALRANYYTHSDGKRAIR